MTPWTEMQPYCTSSRLSRRQFLRMLLGLGGGLALSVWPDRAPGAPSIPAWWMDLVNPLDAHAVSPAIAPPSGPAGSIMKLVAAAALIEERLISPDEPLECRGVLVLDGLRYRCQHVHGKVALRQALGKSCNTYFARAVASLSAKRLLDYAERFGLRDPAADGATYRFPTKPMGPVQGYALGLNKDLAPNALHLLRLAALVATGDVPGVQKNTIRLLHDGMRLAATQGTASRLDPENRYRVAAKTGTVPYGAGYQSWVVGFFPFDAPRYAFCVRSNAGTAMETAVPMARQFLQARRWRWL